MTLLATLPDGLEDADALIARREVAATRKELWRSVYTECYRFAMPSRETFTWTVEGQDKTRQLYDSTLQEYTYEAANTTCAILFPPWSRWAELTAGGAIPKAELSEELIEGFQESTHTFFDFLNSSNFAQVIGEVALDLMIGTGGLSFNEGDDENPFVFTSLPLSAIELEEGPNGAVETTFMLRKPQARNLLRMYEGMALFDLPSALAEIIGTKPEQTIEIIQGEVYNPKNKHYYGVVIDKTSKSIIWRYDYGLSCPAIIARATKAAGELYGRGRVMLALADAKTLDKMQEFLLRNAALQIAPPMTAVSDGVFNPYTAVLAPNTVLPVASNANDNPSLRVLELGGNFAIGDKLMSDLRERVRRAMLGPNMSDGAIKSATEISTADRDRLWAMGGEFGRIQAELLTKIVARGVYILQRKGLMPKFKVDGREVAVKYTSPFARSQNAEDVMALQRALVLASSVGPEELKLGVRTENIPAWAFRKEGVDEALVRPESEKKQVAETATNVLSAAQEAEAGGAVPQGVAA